MTRNPDGGQELRSGERNKITKDGVKVKLSKTSRTVTAVTSPFYCFWIRFFNSKIKDLQRREGSISCWIRIEHDRTQYLYILVLYAVSSYGDILRWLSAINGVYFLPPSLFLCIAPGSSWLLLTFLVCTQFHHHQMSWIWWIIVFKSWQHDESIWIACWMMTEHHLPLSPPGRPWDATNSSEPTTKSACIGAWQKSGRIRCNDGLAMLGLAILASGQFGPVIIFQPRSVFGTWNWRLRCLSGCWSRFLAWLCLGLMFFAAMATLLCFLQAVLQGWQTVVLGWRPSAREVAVLAPLWSTLLYFANLCNTPLPIAFDRKARRFWGNMWLIRRISPLCFHSFWFVWVWRPFESRVRDVPWQTPPEAVDLQVSHNFTVLHSFTTVGSEWLKTIGEFVSSLFRLDRAEPCIMWRIGAGSLATTTPRAKFGI